MHAFSSILGRNHSNQMEYLKKWERKIEKGGKGVGSSERQIRGEKFTFY